MTDRDKLVSQIELHEGRRLKPYVDGVGKITIGVGRNLTDKGLSSREVDDLRDHDLDECITDLSTFPWFVGLDPVRQRVVVDLRFNLGPNGFRRFPKMIHALAIGDTDTAAAEIVSSRAAKQTMGRYDRLARMMRTDFDEVN